MSFTGFVQKTLASSRRHKPLLLVSPHFNMALEYYETVGLARIDLSMSAEAQKGIAQRGAGPCHVAVRKIIAGTPVGSFVPMSAALMKVRKCAAAGVAWSYLLSPTNAWQNTYCSFCFGEHSPRAFLNGAQDIMINEHGVDPAMVSLQGADGAGIHQWCTSCPAGKNV